MTLPAELASIWPASLNERYVADRVLARGGFGVVALARERRSGRAVAVKLLNPGLQLDPIIEMRFLGEAEIIARLDHPRIVPLLEFGLANDHRYMVLPYVQGVSLRQRIKQGRLPLEAALTIAHDIADALTAVHDAGIVHRDVKPDNVLLDADGRAYLTDFGISRSQRSGGLTTAGTILGTPGYIPYDVMCEGPVTSATDIYAFGVMLWEMLVGHRPLQCGPSTAEVTRNGVEEMLATKDETPERPSANAPGIPRWVDALVMAMLDPEPSLRPLASEAAALLARRNYAAVEDTIRVLRAV